MRRHRRLVLIDRVIPFLAALIGLIALAGAVVVQLNGISRSEAITSEMARLTTAVEQANQRASTLSAAPDDGTAEGLLALQDRMVKLESDMRAATEKLSAAAAAPALTDAVPSAETALATVPAKIDPNLPTTDCIPLGTRFMVTPNESYPLCQSKSKIEVGAITADTVDISGAGTVTETGFGTLMGTSCTVMVFSADAEGFAELRVTCT